MKKMKMVECVEREAQYSLLDSLPCRAAQSRAMRDPQPGDRWCEHFTWYCHVDARDNDRVLTRTYVAPGDLTPSAAKEEIWHESPAEFAQYIKNSGACYFGNTLWVAQLGGEYTEGLFDD